MVKTVESIMKSNGVERVRVAGKNETASDMCFAAAENLIKNEGIERSEIDGLVFIFKHLITGFRLLQLYCKID